MPLDLTQPQVAAALAGGTVAAIVSVVLSERRLRVETRLAEKRFAFDRELAQLKFDADIGLADRKFENDKKLGEHKLKLEADSMEKKFAFDKAVVSWRRRYELAEQVLIAAYQARDSLGWARGRGIFEGEGQTRPASGSESEELRTRRNSHFVPLERLARDAKSFATLETLQYAVAAQFGAGLAQAISQFAQAHNEIATAVSYLIKLDIGDDIRGDQSLRPFRETLWGERPDAIDKKIEGAIATIEAVCRPVLAESPPS